MRLDGVGSGFDGEAAGHAEVDAEGGVVVEADEDFFAAAVDGGDAAIGKEGDKIGGGRGDDVGAEVMDVTDAVVDVVGDESADDVLDLGELGHCNFYLKGASVKMTNELKWLEYIQCIKGARRGRGNASPLQ